MKTNCEKPVAEKQIATDTSGHALSRRQFITASVAVGAMILTFTMKTKRQLKLQSIFVFSLHFR